MGCAVMNRYVRDNEQPIEGHMDHYCYACLHEFQLIHDPNSPCYHCLWPSGVENEPKGKHIRFCMWEPKEESDETPDGYVHLFAKGES